MKKEHSIIKVSLSRTTRTQRLKFLQDFIATGVAELKQDCSNCKNKLRCLTKDDLDSNPSYESVGIMGSIATVSTSEINADIEIADESVDNIMLKGIIELQGGFDTPHD